MVDVLIIGSGGTGVKTLLHIKKLIIDQRSELRLPTNIQLLGLDTNETQEKIPGISTAGGAGKWQQYRGEKDKEAYTGALVLDADEYLWTGGVLKDYALGNQATGMPGMPKPDVDSHAWFNHWYFRKNQHILNVSAGAGQFRQVGRLALDYALASGTTSNLYATLSAKIRNLQNNFLVFIVGSLAGGTGAAQYIDLAHLARELALINGKAVQAAYAMLALPEAFKKTPGVLINDAMHARTTAGLRELQRFMEVQEPDMGYLMEYGHGPNGVALSGRTKGALFENVYLFGERFQRPTHPASLLDVDIQYGVCASMAQWCVALADEQAGDTFLRSAVNRYHGVQDLKAKWDQQVQALGGYSPDYVASTGSYSVVLPVASIIEEWTARFAMEQVLERLVPLNNGVPVDDMAAGVQGVSGAQKARVDWMNYPTPVAKDAGGKGKDFDPLTLAENPNQVSKVAGDLQTRTAEKWRAVLSTTRIAAAIANALPSEATEKAVYFYNSEARGALSDPVKGGQVAPQSKKGYQGRSEAAAKFVAEQCDAAINKLLSSYRDAMVECCVEQVKEYRQSLLNFVEITLNGSEHVDEPSYAGQNRAGKAGWLLGYLKERVANLDSALVIWRAAEKGKMPSASEPSKNLNESVYGDNLRTIPMRIEPKAFAKQVVFNLKYHENGSSFSTMSRDEKKQKEYLREVQGLYERERWHLWWLMEYYLIWQFREFTQQLHASLQATVRILRGETDSVESSLVEQRGILKQNRKDAEHWSKVREIVQPSKWEDSKYGEQMKADEITGLFPWQRVLVDFKWQTNVKTQKPNTDDAYPEPTINLIVDGFRVEAEGDLQTNRISPYVELPVNPNHNKLAAAANRSRIRERCSGVFKDAWNDLNILDYLYETYHGNYPNDSKGFAEKLASNCDVLLRYNPSLTPLRFTYLLAPQITGISQSDEDVSGQTKIDPKNEWLSQVDSKIREQLGVKQDNYAGLMYHTDTTALTLFALVDWIQLESLGAFTDGKDTYIKYPSDPRKEGLSWPLEHIFTAEQRAAVHDESQPGRPIELVKTRVSALFDEYKRLERFLKAWVLGFVEWTVYTPRENQGAGPGHLMRVVIPPEPGEIDILRNPITSPHYYWLNQPHDFENDDVPFIIGAETACLRSLEFFEKKEIHEMHARLEKAIQRNLMDIYTNHYSAHWAKGEGDAIGVNLERDYRVNKSDDTLDKLLYVVLMSKYAEFHKILDDYSKKYGSGTSLRDEYAKAAKEHEIKLVSIFKNILEQQIGMISRMNP